MTEDLTAGLDFQEDGQDFVLSVADRNGVTTTVRLTEQQVITLSQSAPAWRERIVLRRSPERRGRFCGGCNAGGGSVLPSGGCVNPDNLSIRHSDEDDVQPNAERRSLADAASWAEHCGS